MSVSWSPLLRVVTQEVTSEFSQLIFVRSGLQINEEMTSLLSILPAALLKHQIYLFIVN